jgi:predicted DsbA family dithiol-disulfide isomerase
MINSKLEYKPEKIKIEIWSDVMCPWCYIGKRRFEKALDEFEHKGEVDVEWKSFQLNPAMKTDPSKNINVYLSEIKGCTLEDAQQMNQQVTGLAKEVGLEYDFDKAVVANSFDAHRLIQYAKEAGKGDQAEERLFKAYFTEGKNIASHETLVQLGSEIGLEENEVKEMLAGERFTDEVKHDVYEARQIGVRGVPFFLFNGKYAISGAQQTELFVDTLKKAWHEGKKNKAGIA